MSGDTDKLTTPEFASHMRGRRGEEPQEEEDMPEPDPDPRMEERSEDYDVVAEEGPPPRRLEDVMNEVRDALDEVQTGESDLRENANERKIIEETLADSRVQYARLRKELDAMLPDPAGPDDE